MTAPVVRFTLDPTDIPMDTALNGLLYNSLFRKFNLTTASHALKQGAKIDFIDINGNTLLHSAVLSSKRLENLNEIVKFLIENDADVLAIGEGNLTPFQLAAKKGFVEAAQAILDNDSKNDLLNHQANDFNKTPLMLACESDEDPMVKFLLEKEANTKLKDFFGNSALFFAHSKKVIKQLLAKGFIIDDKNHKGFTPLKKAVEEKDSDLTEILLDFDAEINVLSDESNENILMYALKVSTIEVLEKLLAKSKKEHITQKDKFGNTVLHLGLGTKDYEKLNLLLKRDDIKELINEKNGDGCTPLEFAILFLDFSSIKILVENGADVTKVGRNHLTPIENVLSSTNVNIIGLILPKLVEKKCFDRLPNFFSSLHIKAPPNQRFFLEKLLQFKTKNDASIFHILTQLDLISNKYFFVDLNNLGIRFNLENKNKDGKTPLEIALESDKEGYVIDCLITNGAKTDKIEPDENGDTPLTKAVKQGNEPLALNLSKHFDVNVGNLKCNNWTPLHFAANLGYLTILRDLLEKGAEDSNEFTAIMAAAISNKTDCLKELLAVPDIKEKINAQYKNKTALMYAAEQGHLEAVKILVENGALLHVKDEKNHTAMDLATIKGKSNVVSHLCDIDIQNYSSYSSRLKLRDPLEYAKKALFLAVEYEQKDIVRLLVNEKNVPVNCVKINYETPLHRACILAKSLIAPVLLELGADINAEMKKPALTAWFYQGKTPLMCAVERANNNTVRVLVNNENCKINLENVYHDNWTALDYALALKAVSSPDSEIFNIVATLQVKGAQTHL